MYQYGGAAAHCNLWRSVPRIHDEGEAAAAFGGAADGHPTQCTVYDAAVQLYRLHVCSSIGTLPPDSFADHIISFREMLGHLLAAAPGAVGVNVVLRVCCPGQLRSRCVECCVDVD